jgi:hypothetical protein
MIMPQYVRKVFKENFELNMYQVLFEIWLKRMLSAWSLIQGTSVSEKPAASFLKVEE